jgi:chromosome segregation ATPase
LGAELAVDGLKRDSDQRSTAFRKDLLALSRDVEKKNLSVQQQFSELKSAADEWNKRQTIVEQTLSDQQTQIEQLSLKRQQQSNEKSEPKPQSSSSLSLDLSSEAKALAQATALHSQLKQTVEHLTSSVSQCTTTQSLFGEQTKSRLDSITKELASVATAIAQSSKEYTEMKRVVDQLSSASLSSSPVIVKEPEVSKAQFEATRKDLSLLSSSVTQSAKEQEELKDQIRQQFDSVRKEFNSVSSAHQSLKERQDAQVENLRKDITQLTTSINKGLLLACLLDHYLTSLLFLSYRDQAKHGSKRTSPFRSGVDCS